MQLFQEYVVGKVSRSPHMFSVTSGDITFLKQFPAEYWVDALWQRYNPVLFGALKKREKQREDAGYSEFVKSKYHEILEQLKSINLDINIKKKRALLQALNLAEEKYTYINVKNKDLSWHLESLIYDEENKTDKKRSNGVFIGNTYIEELVKSLEGSPMNPKGYDLTGIKKHDDTNVHTKSQYSTRGLQFPSRDVIRKSLKRWIEYLGADLLGKTGEEHEKQDFKHIKGKEINDLYEKHWKNVYFNFFLAIKESEESEDLENFVNENREALLNISKILKDNSIDEMVRSVKGHVGFVKFVKERLVKILQPSTLLEGLKELKGYLINRARCRHLAELLSKTELRIARKNKTFVDPHNRMPGYDKDTNTDELFHPRTKMIKVKIKERDPKDLTKHIEKIIEIPDLKRGRILLPIHDMPEEQGHKSAVGNFSAYEDIHNASGQKRIIRPFKMVTQEELRLNPKMKKKRIIAGGLVSNQNSPYRSGLLSKEEEFPGKIEDIRKAFMFRNYNFERDEEGAINPVSSATGTILLSKLVVDYLLDKLTKTWTETFHGTRLTFRWKEWAKCLNEASYKQLHDHCVEILADNYEQIISKDPTKKIRETLDYLFQRMSQLNFGSGTSKQRSDKKISKTIYDCSKINEIIERFYSGHMHTVPDITSSVRNFGRRHDLANRASYQMATEEADLTPDNWLQLFRRLVNAYMRKFPSENARASAELCTSSFMKGITSSGQDLEVAVNAEITRLAIPEEKPNCEIEETRNFYKKAYEIFINVVSGNATVVSPEEINILEKLANPTTSHYNTKIDKLVKILKERTTALTELFSAINSYNPIGDVNLPTVAAKIATIKNMDYNAFIVSDAIKRSASDILSKRRKMNTLTVRITDYDIRGILTRIVSDRK